MLKILNTLPENDQTFHDSIYKGAIYILPANVVSQSIILDIRAKIEKEFGSDMPETIHQICDPDDIHKKMGLIRDEVKNPHYSIPAIAQLFRQLGFGFEHIIFDVLRARCVPHDGYKNPKTAHSFTMHRDTWYANPACQINWWIPIYDVDQEQTFQFFPAYFEKPIANTSHGFDYASWSTQVGFQAKQQHSVALYPTVTEAPEDAEASAFCCKAGDIVLFSAAHLHQTCQNDSGKTRFSMDFRTVYTPDKQAGKGAPDPDNQSRGDATVDYLKAL